VLLNHFDQSAVWVENSGEPRESCIIDGDQHPAWEGAILRVKGGPLYTIGTLCREL